MYYLKLITKQIDKFYEPKKPKRRYRKKAYKDLLGKELISALFKDIIENNIEDNGIKIERYVPTRILGASLNGEKKEGVK